MLIWWDFLIIELNQISKNLKVKDTRSLLTLVLISLFMCNLLLSKISISDYSELLVLETVIFRSNYYCVLTDVKMTFSPLLLNTKLFRVVNFHQFWNPSEALSLGDWDLQVCSSWDEILDRNTIIFYIPFCIHDVKGSYVFLKD